jgi:hypothetical protein
MYLSPLSKKQATTGKNPSENIPTTMYTCTQLATAKNTKLIWKRDQSAVSTIPLCLAPFVKEQATAAKPPVEIPTNNEHLCTADHRYKQKNINLIWRTEASALYPYSQAAARVQTKI